MPYSFNSNFQRLASDLVIPLVISVGLVATSVLITGLLKLRKWYSLRNLPTQILKVSPPLYNDKTAQATQQLFSVIHGLEPGRSWWTRLTKPSMVLSLEIVASRAHGIRYLIRAPKDRVKSLEAAIAAYLPEAKLSLASDYLAAEATTVISFRQKIHFAFPLLANIEPERQDPLAYLTSSMTKLKPGEIMSLQLVIKPVRPASAERLLSAVMRNEDIEAGLNKLTALKVNSILRLVNGLLFGLADAVTFAYHTPSGKSYSAPQKEHFQRSQAALKLRPARILSPFEQQLYESVHDKLSQPLFGVDIRAMVLSDDYRESKRRLNTLSSAMASFRVPKYQALILKKHRFSQRYTRYLYNHRLPRLLARRSTILAASELAGLYHFPNQRTTKTENLNKSLSRTLPAPISLKDGSKLDVLLGVNYHQGSSTPIGLTTAERQRHVYIIGGTGNGKTTMLQYAIVQDIQAGKGLAILDPHGDLAESLLGYIPKERVKDVIYFNPDDISYPIGMNLLELPEGLEGDELLREKDLVTESTISVMRKIFSDDDTGGHRIEYILRNTIQTALTLENPTLFTIYDLLNDTRFRRGVIKNLEDKDLRNFWKNELGKAGEFQRVKMAAGITAKIGRFLFSASAKRVLEQEKSTIDFDDILNFGKILICNFSKGLLGEDTSTLFGTTVLAKLQMASLRRARLKQSDRRPFYLYVDEFQNFATMSFVQMLSEARKYKLFLTMAEQSTSQQDQQRLVDIILANVGTVICFRSGSPADELLVLPLLSPFIEQGEIPNLPAYNFYMRIAAIKAQEPLSGETRLLDNKRSIDTFKQVVKSSRAQNATKYQAKRTGLDTEKKKAVRPNLLQKPIDI